MDLKEALVRIAVLEREDIFLKNEVCVNEEMITRINISKVGTWISPSLKTKIKRKVLTSF